MLPIILFFLPNFIQFGKLFELFIKKRIDLTGRYPVNSLKNLAKSAYLPCSDPTGVVISFPASYFPFWHISFHIWHILCNCVSPPRFRFAAPRGCCFATCPYIKIPRETQALPGVSLCPFPLTQLISLSTNRTNVTPLQAQLPL